MQNQNYSLVVQDVVKHFGKQQILNKLSMKVERGQIYGLLGSSGCGKTTLLSTIIGRRDIESGEIWVLGRKTGKNGTRVPGFKFGYMPQEIALVQEFTVKDSIFFFGRIFNMKEKLIEKRYQELSDLLNLPPGNRYLWDCSGGEQRRVSFAVALVHKPPLLILDEPTVGIDPLLREKIWAYLVQIAKEENISVILTTHYIEECRQADKKKPNTTDAMFNCLETAYNSINKDEAAVAAFCDLTKAFDFVSHGLLLQKLQHCSIQDAALRWMESYLSGRIQFIGLMREGSILVEAAPNRLLTAFNTDSLEEVYFLLAKQQDKGALLLSNLDSSDTVDLAGSSTLTISSSTQSIRGGHTSTDELIEIPNSSCNIINRKRMRALYDKNAKQFYRNAVGSVFLLGIPLVQVFAIVYCVGLNMKDIPIGVVNDESRSAFCPNFSINGTARPDEVLSNCYFENLSCRFLQQLDNNSMITKVEYNNTEDAYYGATHGKVYGIMHFSKNFSKSFERTMNDALNVDEAVINVGHIQVKLDMSNFQIANSVKRELIEVYIDFQKSLFNDCKYLPRAADLPVKTEFIFGYKNEPYQVYMLQGMVVLMMFIFGSMITSITIITEKSEGIWDRSIVAGVTSTELILSHLSFQSIIIMIQALEMIVTVYLIFNFEYAGSVWLMVFIVFLQGLCGMSYGMFISTITTNQTMANNAIMGFFLPLTIINGCLWPLQGMPKALQIFSRLMPNTVSAEAFNGVVKKGLSLNDWNIVAGLLIPVAWIIFLGLLSLFFLKRQR